MFKEYFEDENSLFSTVPTWMKADFISPLWRQNFFRPMRMATGCDPCSLRLSHVCVTYNTYCHVTYSDARYF